VQLDVAGLVESRRVRLPLRWVTRSSVRSYRAAPIAAVASASMSSWRTSDIASRMTSVEPPTRMASSSSDRADCERAIGVSFVIPARNMLRFTPVAPDRTAQPASGALPKSHHLGGHTSAGAPLRYDAAGPRWTGGDAQHLDHMEAA